MKNKLALLAIVPLSLLLLTGCSHSEEKVEGAGNLSEINVSQPVDGATFLSSDIQVGVAVAEDPIPVFDEPDGVTIGRLPAGDYTIVQTKDFWVSIVISQYKTKTGDLVSQTGWVPESEVKMLIGSPAQSE